MGKLEQNIQVLIAELESIEKSMVFPLAGYKQTVMGTERFTCMVCGHCPGALIERLKLMLPSETPSPPKQKKA